jgi:hypothetical protein
LSLSCSYFPRCFSIKKNFYEFIGLLTYSKLVILGMYLEEGVGRAGTAACDLNSHDYLYIQGGRDGSDGQPGGTFSEPTEEKFCGRSLSGLAVTESSDRMRSGYVLDPPDNNTLVSTVTSKFITVRQDMFWNFFPLNSSIL